MQNNGGGRLESTTNHGTIAEDGDEFIVTLAETVAVVRECDPLALPPLGHVVDADAVASIALHETMTAEFEYAGCSVFAAQNGHLQVERLDEEGGDDLV